MAPRRLPHSALICLLSCLWLLPGAASGAEEARRHIPARPDKPVPTLEVNTGMAYRGVAALDEARGVARLQELAAQSEFEEIWAYIPSQGLWVELGCCERTTERGNYVALESHLLKLMARYPRLAVYHIHPHTRFIRDNYHEVRRRIKVLEEALPSRADMATMLMLTRRFRRYQPEGEITWAIVSRHGVTRYGVDEAALGPDEEPDLRPFAFSAWSEGIAGDLGPMETPAFLEVPAGQAIDQACRDLSRPPLEVSFRPHPGR